MNFETYAIPEWNKEHHSRLARSYADSQADAIMVQMWLAKALEHLGGLFVSFGQYVNARSIQQQEQMVPIPVTREQGDVTRRRE